MNEGAIATGLAEDDPKALEALYEAYGERVLSTANNALGDRAAAEEVRQEVFNFLWDHRKSFDPDRETLSSWVMMTARSHTVDRLRARRPTADTEELELATVQGVQDPAPVPEPEPAAEPEPEPAAEPEPEPEAQPEPAAQPEPDPEAHAAIPVPYERRPRAIRRRRARRRVTFALGVIAVIAAGVGTALVLSNQSADEGSALVLAPLDSSPDGGPSGTATLGSVGEEARFELVGLDRRAGTAYYGLWLLNSPRDALPLGAVQAGADEEASVTVPLPVEPTSYRYIDVSAEPDDGDAAHSGVTVLRAATGGG